LIPLQVALIYLDWSFVPAKQIQAESRQTAGREPLGDSSFRNQIETTARRPANSNPLIIERPLLAIDSKSQSPQPMKDEAFA
jgi:hypothetical protein